jgi:hypothetical protein
VSLGCLRQSLFLRDFQRGVFVALDHRAKISGRDVMADVAGFFDSGAQDMEAQVNVISDGCGDYQIRLTP